MGSVGKRVGVRAGSQMLGAMLSEGEKWRQYQMQWSELMW